MENKSPMQKNSEYFIPPSRRWSVTLRSLSVVYIVTSFQRVQEGKKE